MIFTPASAEAVAAAREAVASAERLRIAECGAENEKRGPSCRKREADEQAKREAFSTLTVNKAASDRAAALDASATAIRARINNAQAVQSSNPGAAALSRLLRIEVDDAVSLSALLGALALELAGMAAMMRADAHRQAPEVTSDAATEPTSNEVSQPDAAATMEPTTAGLAMPVDNSAVDADTVGRFMLACLKRAKGQVIAGGAIFTRYQRWCAEQQPILLALDAKAFAQEFASRCGRVSIRTRREGGKVYCLDVRLAA